MKLIIPTLENKEFDSIQIDRIIEMAWEDRTPFDAIKFQFGISEAEVKALMKKEFKCKLQRAISNNKISKR